MKNSARQICLGLLLLVVAYGTGCNNKKDSPGGGGEDAGKIRLLISNTADMSRNIDQLKPLFTSDVKLTEEQRKKFHDYTILTSTEKPPRFDGNTCTVGVVIKDAAGKELPSQEWTAVKEGDKWLLKSAPLP